MFPNSLPRDALEELEADVNSSPGQLKTGEVGIVDMELNNPQVVGMNSKRNRGQKKRI